MQYDILIPGNYFCDLIFTGFPAFPALGTEIYTTGLNVVPGGVMNTVIALHRLGVNVGWAGMVGTDFFSRYILETARQEGIDIALLTQQDHLLQRVTVSVSYPQDRAFITYVDQTTSTAEIARSAVTAADFRHLHFTGLTIHPLLPDVLKSCRQRGSTISMDCQHRDETLGSAGVRDILSLVDFFMPNATEAQRLTGTESITAAAAILKEIVPHVLIKDGVNGVHFWHGDDYFHAPALSFTPVDTTGAGDVFNAGFLAAYLNGQDWLTCLRWGNICGGYSTQGYGGASTAPTRTQVEATYTANYPTEDSHSP
jgi:sugar/nucleoside kinase (ribokinase family)